MAGTDNGPTIKPLRRRTLHRIDSALEWAARCCSAMADADPIRWHLIAGKNAINGRVEKRLWNLARSVRLSCTSGRR